jgi:hypothetical protein
MIKTSKTTEKKTKAAKNGSAAASATTAKSAPVAPNKTASAAPVSSVSTVTPAKKAPEVKADSAVRLELVLPEAKSVAVAGSFNSWKPEATPLQSVGNGHWTANLKVTPGRYEYLLVVDGKWIPDPNAKEVVQNPYGGCNSVLVVNP